MPSLAALGKKNCGRKPFDQKDERAYLLVGIRVQRTGEKAAFRRYRGDTVRVEGPAVVLDAANDIRTFVFQAQAYGCAFRFSQVGAFLGAFDAVADT